MPVQRPALGGFGQSCVWVATVHGCVQRKTVCITKPRHIPLAQSPSTVQVAPNAFAPAGAPPARSFAAGLPALARSATGAVAASTAASAGFDAGDPGVMTSLPGAGSGGGVYWPAPSAERNPAEFHSAEAMKVCRRRVRRGLDSHRTD